MINHESVGTNWGEKAGCEGDLVLRRKIMKILEASMDISCCQFMSDDRQTHKNSD